METKKRFSYFFDKYSCVYSFFFSAIAIYLLLLCVGMDFSGDYLLLRGDGFEQYMGDIRMVTRSILNHENPLYQFCVSMGFSAVLSIALEVINPFNILYLVFNNVDVNQITIVILVLKIGVIGASFHLFSREICKTDVFWATVFSLFYSMSAFPIAYGTVYIFWLDVLYVIPICAIAVNRALYNKKTVLLTVVFSYIFITQFYMGYLTGIFGLLYYLLLLFFNRDQFKRKEFFYAIVRFAVSAINAILISAIVWIPVLKFLLRYNPSDRTMFSEQQIGFMEVFNNFFWGQIQTTGWAPYIYCGIPSLLLLLLFFLNNKIQIREKFVYGFLFLFYVLGCMVLPLYRLLHGFDAPDNYDFRFSFMLSFFVCAIACKQIVYIKNISLKYLLIWGIILISLYLLEGRFEKFELGTFSSNTGFKFVINMAFFLLWLIIFLLGRKKNNSTKVFYFLVLSIAIIEVVSNGYATLNAYGVMELNGKKKKEYSDWKEEYELVLDAIQGSNVNDFYRVVAFGDYLHNSDSYFGYNGISDFCTGENENLRHLMEDLGLFTSKAETYATGMTPSLAMLLSVKYEVYLNNNTLNPEETGITESKETNFYLPLGYMVRREALTEIPMERNVFENQNVLFQTLTNVGEIYEPVMDEQIEFIEDGLSVLPERKIIEKYRDEGELLFVVRNEVAPVYVQIEQEKKKVYGIAFLPFENMATVSDAFVSFPIAAKMNKFDDSTNYIEIISYEDFVESLSFDKINIYRLNEEKLKENYSILSQNVLNVEKWNNGYVRGSIDVDDADKILLTSIPMVDGWTVLVDGKEMEPREAVNGVFMAVDIQSVGHHTIEFKYNCPGLKAGVLISLMGILLFVGQICACWIVSRKQKG